jgi:hypothetical protein
MGKGGKNMKCSICEKDGEGMVFIIPPDESAYYHLECLAEKYGATLRDSSVVVVRIKDWLELLGHKI